MSKDGYLPAIEIPEPRERLYPCLYCGQIVKRVMPAPLEHECDGLAAAKALWRERAVYSTVAAEALAHIEQWGKEP